MTTTHNVENDKEARLDEAERRLISVIQELQESYFKAAEPYVKRLIAIRNSRAIKHIISVEQARAMRLMP